MKHKTCASGREGPRSREPSSILGTNAGATLSYERPRGLPRRCTRTYLRSRGTLPEPCFSPNQGQGPGYVFHRSNVTPEGRKGRAITCAKQHPQIVLRATLKPGPCGVYAAPALRELRRPPRLPHLSDRPKIEHVEAIQRPLLVGEQSNAWRILLRNDRKSRHRRIKKRRRYERLAATSQLSLW
ncbi:hypothetical protein HPB49_007308 [Dermacentor silvarum]|uniref:Uncharacterized protein n=1 Tax=Dermacentor silvarum TaxID=543639 RepID=A0ACB8C2J7_DERSI|nr:hypothetical protein HPB49_007308 [Dermacentor silvarum]